jgi:transposase
MELYCGMDLHSSNTVIGITDERRNHLIDRKLPNDPELIRNFLKPYKAQLKGIVVESTYNWYWLVDMLQEEQYRVHLSHPVANQQYKGLKHSNDKHEAFWLAELLNLGILKEGYIYPRQVRSLRDVLRKRAHLVRIRSALIVSLQNIVHRNCAVKVTTGDIKRLTADFISPCLSKEEALLLAGKTSKEVIDCLTRQIDKIERWALKRLGREGVFTQLVTLPGVGDILGMTILLETGSVSRFRAVGNYVSYCRKVSSQWTSNDKVKGRGNIRNGNKYLAWAFSEAAEHARRTDEACRRFYDRKLRQTNARVAHNALAHKLARAAYYIIKDHVSYQEEKMFS